MYLFYEFVLRDETLGELGKYIPEEAVLISYDKILLVSANDGTIRLGLHGRKFTAAMVSSCCRNGIRVVSYFY